MQGGKGSTVPVLGQFRLGVSVLGAGGFDDAGRRFFTLSARVLVGVPVYLLLRQLSPDPRWLSTCAISPNDQAQSAHDLIVALEVENIEARPVWKPMHLQPLYAGALYYSHEEDDSVSEKFFQSGICLPSGSNLTISQQDRIIEVIKNFFS